MKWLEFRESPGGGKLSIDTYRYFRGRLADRSRYLVGARVTLVNLKDWTSDSSMISRH